MSLSFDSLSGLAEVAFKVEKTLYLSNPSIHTMTRGIFGELQDDINILQTTCPNHPGVLAARVRWFQIDLKSFEKHIVEPAEQDEWPERVSLDSPKQFSPEDLLTGTATLTHFLKRGYLKRDFPFLYLKMMSLLRRITEADMVDRGREKAFISELICSLESSLLEGKL